MAGEDPGRREGPGWEPVTGGSRPAPAAWLQALPPLHLLLGLLLALTLAAGELTFRWGILTFVWSRGMALQVWLLATVVLVLVLRQRRRPWSDLISRGSYWLPLVPVSALIILMASNVRRYSWFFFLDPRVVISVVLLAPPIALLLEVVERKKLGRFVYPLLLIAAQVYLATTLWHTTGGHPIYRDDHPSFMYRLWLTVQAFPHVYFYNPFWNGGYLGHELVSTGALSLGYLAFPFVALFGVEKVYLPFLLGIFVVAIPWVCLATVRSLKVSPFAAWAAAFLSLGTNRFFFVNFLSYGTGPSLLASFLTVVVWALLFEAVQRGKLGFRRWLALVVCLNLMLFYPGSAIMLFPVAVACLIGIPRLNRRVLFFIVSAAVVLAILYGGIIYRYLHLPKFRAFMAHESAAAAVLYAGKAMSTLSGALKHTNPLILVAGFLGLLWPRKRDEFLWLLPPVLIFMLLIGAGPQLKPHLQLHRMVIPLSFFLIIPAATVFSRATKRRDLPSALLRGVVGAVLLLTVLNVGALFRNRGKEVFWPMTSDARELVGWVRRNVPPEGRLFFAGPSVHAYGGGHVSYLQAATGRNMIAGDFYHFDPRLTDYNPVPKSFRGSGKKLREYFELMGVTHVVTYKKEWKAILRKRKTYRFEKAFGRKEMFSTGVEPGFLLKGTGKVTPSINSIEVSLDGPQDEVVLKFLWQPGMTTEPPVTMRPVEAAPGITFISVRPGGRAEFVIRYRP